MDTEKILEQFRPELERAREKYKRIKNVNTQEIISEMRELVRIFDEVFSRIGLERFNDTSTLIKVAADRRESQEREIERLKKTIDRQDAVCYALADRAEQAEAQRDELKEKVIDYELAERGF